MFAEIHNHEVIAQSNYWGDILYDGPKMRPLSRSDTDLYRRAVRNVMENPSEKNLYKLFDVVNKRISDENYPVFKRIRAACQSTSLYPLKADGGTTTIENGVSRGERVTLTIVPNLNFSSFIYECNQEFSE